MPDKNAQNQHSAAKALCLSGDELATLFPAYLSLDCDGRIRDAGPSLLRHFGPDLVDLNLFDCVTIERPSKVGTVAELRQHRRALILQLNGQEPLRLRGIVLDRGDLVWLLLGNIPDVEGVERKQPLQIADFSPTDGTLDMMLAAEMRSGLLAEARALAAELEKQRNEAEEANRAKSAFLTTMSHEIRTPMNAVLGVADILSNTPITREQREWLDVMVESGHSLMALLNNVLDLSKIESGLMEIKPEAVDLPALVSSVHSLFAPTAAAKELDLRFEVDLQGDHYLVDPVRLRQVLCNLVGNATKFTEVGSVSIIVRDRLDGDTRWLEFSVSDTGIGISAEAISRLFNVFSQADSSTTRRYGGTGLGLSISKQLTEQMGGRIDVESRVGRGSSFTAAIPVELVAEPAQPQPEPVALADRTSSLPQHILIVDDNATNSKILSHYLGRIGLTFEVASDGQKALIAWEEGEYDLIIMDIEMPVLDGLEATREIRRRESATGRPYTPIIGLSADAMIQKRETALSVGMDDFLTKPVGLKEIKERINSTRTLASNTGT
jgi:signal transduction histidine kinase/ActR/RegA family two-component response regulator